MSSTPGGADSASETVYHDSVMRHSFESEPDSDAHLLRDMSSSMAESVSRDKNGTVIDDDGHKYTIAQGGNSSETTYQDANGAPVESVSPLGKHVGWMTVIGLNIGKMIGTGIFSTRMSHSQ